MSNYEKHIETLVEKAATAMQSTDALHWSQAASNSANALRQLADMREKCSPAGREVFLT